MTQQLMTLTQVCEETNTGKTTLYKLIKEGRLLAVKVGTKTLVRREDMNAWVASLDAFNAQRQGC